MAYKEYETSSSFETYSRAGFIKACHILASGHVSTGNHLVGITGSMNVESLERDAFINALDEGIETKKYDMPPSPKMAFEVELLQAAHFPVREVFNKIVAIACLFCKADRDIEYVRKQTNKAYFLLCGQ